uniref:Uncharacterized protein n=1 Tax=Rhizophora mucronata TaxID=61149 RepID=A0A2P2NQ76_RHIMU
MVFFDFFCELFGTRFCFWETKIFFICNLLYHRNFCSYAKFRVVSHAPIAYAV